VSTSPAPRRRNRTPRRERLLEFLRASEEHPTAARLHAWLLPEFPELSLGTVYRNLDVLAASGSIQVLRDSAGRLRYDGNVAPHHHFRCAHCGHIQDLDLPLPRRLLARVEERIEGRVEQICADFVGTCRACLGERGTDSISQTNRRTSTDG